MQMSLFSTGTEKQSALKPLRINARVAREQVMLIDRPSPAVRLVARSIAATIERQENHEEEVERWDGLY